jgi:regulator of replication initiation timing
MASAGGWVVPLTVAAGGAALWSLSRPAPPGGHAENAALLLNGAAGGGRLAALSSENSALRERLNATREAHVDVQRQLSELRAQLQRLEAEANPIRRKCDRLREQLEMERARHAESTRELSSEAARLRDYSNELIFTMIMNGVTPDAMSVSLPKGSSAETGVAEESEHGGRVSTDLEQLAEENRQLSEELARLRGALVRAVGASFEVTEEHCRQGSDNGSRNASDSDSWPSPDGISALAEQRRRCAEPCSSCSIFASCAPAIAHMVRCTRAARAALSSIEPYVLASGPHHASPAISPATTPIKGHN